MQGPQKLLQNENSWLTKMGAWFPEQGRVIFRGKDLHHDLKDLSWMAMLIYGITGRIPTEDQVRLFEGIWTMCTSYPDPRLWNNRVAALAGTARSTAALGISAATAVSEASIYGRRPDIRAVDFLYRTKRDLDSGAKLDDLVRTELEKYRVIPGFGRPVTRNDERLEILMALAKKLGFANGPYVELVFKVKQVLTQGRFRMQMNVAALGAALTADQGFSARETYHYTLLSFSIGLVACYLDANEKQEGTLFPLRCTRIKYSGISTRQWDDCAQG